MDGSRCEEFYGRIFSSACAWAARGRDSKVYRVATVLVVDQDHPIEFGGFAVVDSVAGCGVVTQSKIDDSTSVIALQALEDREVGIVDRQGDPLVYAIAGVVEEVVTDVSFASVKVGGGVSDHRHLQGIVDRPERCTKSVRDGGVSSARGG